MLTVITPFHIVLIVTRVILFLPGDTASDVCSLRSVVVNLTKHSHLTHVNVLRGETEISTDVLQTLHEHGVSTNLYSTLTCADLIPSTHTALYWPSTNFLVWISDDAAFSVNLRTLKRSSIISSKSKVMVITKQDVRREVLEKATEGDKIVLVRYGELGNLISVQSLWWSSSGKGSFVTVCKTAWLRGFVFNDVIFARPIKNFHGRLFTISLVKDEEYFTKTPLEILKSVSKIYNFSYTLELPLASNFGVQEANKSWNGIVGQLSRRERDIGVTSLTWTEEREKVLEYTRYFMVDDITFITKVNTPMSQFEALLKLFQAELWTLYLLTWLLCGTTVALFWALSEKVSDNYQSFSSLKKLFKSIWACYEISLWQGSKCVPFHTSPRIVFGSWCVVSLIVLSTYSGNIQAFLNVKHVKKPADTVEEALRTRNKFYFDTGSSSAIFLQNSSNEAYMEIWNKHRSNNHETGINIITSPMLQVNKGGIVVSQRAWLTYHKVSVETEEDCMYHIASEKMQQEYWSLGLQKGSPLSTVFNEGIENMRMAGLIHFWDKNNIYFQSPQSHMCRSATGGAVAASELRTVGLDDVGVAFVILLCGCSLAMIVFLGELTMTWTRK